MPISDYIWFERHRPKNINDLVLPENTKKAFEQYIEDETIPHLLLHGDAGGGKTSMAQILMNALPCKSLILNASSKDRGIETMKTTVVDFAKSKSVDGKLKIILMDEADGLTPDAQFSLKNTIETYHKTCRFILTANIVGKIIDPIKSRCTVYTFGQFPVGDMVKTVCQILKKEEVEFDRRAVSALVNRLYPDFRSIINTAQSCSIGGTFKIAAAGGAALKISEFEENLNNGDLRAIREQFVGMQDFAFLYRHLFNKWIMTISDDLRAEAAQVIAQHLVNDSTVVDREINMCSCVIGLMTIMEVKIKF